MQMIIHMHICTFAFFILLKMVLTIKLVHDVKTAQGIAEHNFSWHFSLILSNWKNAGLFWLVDVVDIGWLTPRFPFPPVLFSIASIFYKRNCEVLDRLNLLPGQRVKYVIQAEKSFIWPELLLWSEGQQILMRMDLWAFVRMLGQRHSLHGWYNMYLKHQICCDSVLL